MSFTCPLINASRDEPKPGEPPLELCRRNPPCEPHHVCGLAKRVAQLISQLSEPSNVAKAVTSLSDLLAAEKLNISDVANLIKKNRYSTQDMKFIFNKGIEKGQREAGQQQLQNVAPEFFDIDGNPRWIEITTFNFDNIGTNPRRTTPWEKEFTADIIGKVLGHEPSPKQAQCILRIFIKLGGRCGPNIQARYFQR